MIYWFWVFGFWVLMVLAVEVLAGIGLWLSSGFWGFDLVVCLR